MSKRKTRVLIAWEMGAGMGHIVPLARIAEALKGRGMEMCSAYLCQLENAHILAPHMAGPIRQAPAISPTLQQPGTVQGDFVTFADFLGDSGYASAETIARQIGLWRRIFEEDRPDLVLADFSPAALTAARSMGIGTVASGAPYCLPPADAPEFPVLANRSLPARYREAELLDIMNNVLASYNAESLTAFPQIFDADVACVSSLRVLDYYNEKRTVPILPPLQRTVPPATKPGQEIVVFTSTPGPLDDPLWEALVQLDAPVLLLASGLDEDVKAKLARPHITLQQGLLAPAELAARCRVLVNNGNHGTLCLAVRAALPQVCLPLHGEQASNCVGLAARGAAIVVPKKDRTAGDIANAVREAHASQFLTARARALAAEYAPLMAGDPAQDIADQIEAVVDLRAQYLPAPAPRPVRKPRPMAGATAATTGLRCYRIHANAPELKPARSERVWMNDTSDRYAYRCVPLTMANSSGWELLLPAGFEATWDGRPSIEAITLRGLNGAALDTQIVTSHFGHGVLTMHTGYLLRTDPGWGIWARGAPNEAKDGIAALDGLVETDWLPFPFTMNWRFTRPCTVRFERGEVFCFFMPVAHMALEQIEPEMLYLSDDPALKAEYEAWSTSRSQFLTKLHAGDADTVKEAWQRFYVRGNTATGQVAPDTHRAKRRLAPGRSKSAPGDEKA